MNRKQLENIKYKLEQGVESHRSHHTALILAAVLELDRQFLELEERITELENVDSCPDEWEIFQEKNDVS